MKILFLTRHTENLVCAEFWHHIEQALGKITKCKWAGKGWPLYKPKEPLHETVNRVMPNADWVIVNIKTKIPKKRPCKIAAYIGDIHGSINKNLSPNSYAKSIRDKKLDALFMAFTHIDGVNVAPDFYLKLLKIPIFRISPCIDPNVFKPIKGKKKFDTVFLGSVNPIIYPLRVHIWHNLPRLAKRNDWSILRKGRPKGSTYERNIDKLLEEGYIVGHKYVETLQRTKTYLFCTSIFSYPLIRLCEGMSTGALTMSSKPLLSKTLHYIPDWNFVEIHKNNWGQRLKYYLSHHEERIEIVSNALDTVLKYHTLDIRAREWLAFLEKHR